MFSHLNYFGVNYDNFYGKHNYGYSRIKFVFTKFIITK